MSGLRYCIHNIYFSITGSFIQCKLTMKMGQSSMQFNTMRCPRIAPQHRGLARKKINLLIIWWPGLESNQRHGDFQSPALPTELPGHVKASGVLKRLTQPESSRWRYYSHFASYRPVSHIAAHNSPGTRHCVPGHTIAGLQDTTGLLPRYRH